MKTQNKCLWILFGFLAIFIGLYPLAYFSSTFKQYGLLSSKSQQLLVNVTYMAIFYTHISFGGLALLTGWSQFSKSWRNKHPTFHRYLGYIYVTSVFVSSIAGFIIAFFATGGAIAGIGFGTLAVLWFITILFAFINIKRGNIKEHEKWMIRNYALAFAAVTLRIYLPFAMLGTGDIGQALQIVAYLCWIPNAIVTEIYIQRGNADLKQKNKDHMLLDP